MREVWIVSAARTPIGSFLGSLSSLTAPQLGSIAIREAIKRAKLSFDEPSEVYMGCVLTGGQGQAPARQAALGAGVSVMVPCTTIGKVCGSGLKSIMLAAQAISSGEADIVVAGGMESMSNAPFVLHGARQGLKFGNTKLVDSMVGDGLWDVYNDYHMGNAAELCARKENISRERQDAFARKSYERALKSIRDGFFKDEIVPVEIRARKGDPTLITEDEEPGKANFDKFPKLKPAFDPKGTVTAANASSLNDGAAAVVLMAEGLAKKKNLKPLARIKGQAQAAREPEWFTVAPADAINKLFEKLQWSSDTVDLYEINEAFSVVSLAVNARLGLSSDKVNVHGGSVALGHPIGASGARILVTLLYALNRHEKKRGVASLCLGGGEAVALGVERDG